MPCHSVVTVKVQEARQYPACDDNPHPAHTIEISPQIAYSTLSHLSIHKEMLTS